MLSDTNTSTSGEMWSKTEVLKSMIFVDCSRDARDINRILPIVYAVSLID